MNSHERLLALGREGALKNDGSPDGEWTLTPVGDEIDKTQVFHVPVPECRVGRSVDAELRIPDRSISKSHARLFIAGNRLTVEDLGSTNGTMVNGVPICRSALHNGDIIQFANVVYRVCGIESADLTGTIQNGTIHSVTTLLNFETLMSERSVIPHYQPIIDLENRGVQGYEVLARSNVEGLEMPRDMFSTAEQLQQHVALSELMREEGARIACEAGKTERQIYFNIHPKEFGTLRLTESLESLRECYPDLAVVIEVHESAIAKTIALKQFQATLKRLEMRLSYDDFGAGQTRLIELTEVPPDVLKFDMQLIRDIDEAPASRQELVRSLVKIANDNGTVSLAEGIETEAEHVVCAEIGFHLAQGYLYGHPEPFGVAVV